MGHKVVTAPDYFINPNHKLRNLVIGAYRAGRPQAWLPHEKWALQTARSQKFDLVLCLTQTLRGEVLTDLRDTGVDFCVAWWGDTPANMVGMGLLEDGWDRIYIKDAAAVRKFHAVGLPAELLPEACNPDWHKRLFETVGNELVIAGSYYGYRQILVDHLAQRNVPMALYGRPPPRWAHPSIAPLHRGRYIVKNEKSQIFGEGVAVLNSTALSEGDALNCRAFEVAGACGLQLIEDKPSVETCFEPGKEVLIYRSVDEIEAHIDHAKSDPSWAMEIRMAGQKRAYAEHTYRHRLTSILSDLELAEEG